VIRAVRRVRRPLIGDDRGSSPVEFVLVGGLVTLLTFAVIQFALAVYVRNVVHDAAVEGAFHAALADTTAADGEDRVREIVARTVGESYAGDVTVREGDGAVAVTVRTTLPIIGLIGLERAMEVSAHAPSESLG
jgi:Flp pilus assembly protein TadG